MWDLMNMEDDYYKLNKSKLKRLKKSDDDGDIKKKEVTNEEKEKIDDQKRFLISQKIDVLKNISIN